MIKGATRTVKDALEYDLAQGVPEATPDAGIDNPPTVLPTNGLRTLLVKYSGACQRLYAQGQDGREP